MRHFPHCPALAWALALCIGALLPPAQAGTVGSIFANGFEQADACRAQGAQCSSDSECCNSYCDRPGGAITGQCATIGGCVTRDEPCGPTGENGSCCSSLCAPSGSGGAGSCARLGGCMPLGEVCTTGLECCSGSCVPGGTTLDGRSVLRCATDASCQLPGGVCVAGSSNCCPSGGGDFGCVTASTGINRCVGGVPGCVLPGAACGSTKECCAESFPNIQCLPGTGGSNVCCLPPGQACAFGDNCCSGVCAPGPGGALVCAAACLAGGASCTTDTDCCGGSCSRNAAGVAVCAVP